VIASFKLIWIFKYLNGRFSYVLALKEVNVIDLVLLLFVANFLPIQGPANLVIDTNCWQREHEWRQETAVVTKWLSGASPVCF